MLRKSILSVLLLVLFIFSVTQVHAQTGTQKTLEYYVRTITDENGNQVDEIIVPGHPPENYRAPIAEPTESSVILSDVPAFNWSFGCSATSAAMMAGYYDRTGYPNMYTGPGGSPPGVMPLDNSEWGDVWIPSEGQWRHQCPLSATMNGLDGRTTLGHVDDYWYDYGDTLDPYYGNWTQHAYGECTGDYMGTNQYQNWHNTDGSTTFYFNTNGTPLYDFTACESYSPPRKDGCHGFRQFFESRGYTVTTNYSQYIDTYHPSGFTFAQFKAEIDAGRPVMIQVSGHSMVGYGYDDTGNLVYIHDTWDYNQHTMTWGGSYSGHLHYGVGVYVLEPAQTVATPTFNPPAGTYATAQDVTISCSTSGTTIYYTTDGTDPDTTDTQYTSPVHIATTTTLKAIAYHNLWEPSSIATGLYEIAGPYIYLQVEYNDGTPCNFPTELDTAWAINHNAKADTVFWGDPAISAYNDTIEIDIGTLGWGDGDSIDIYVVADPPGADPPQSNTYGNSISGTGNQDWTDTGEGGLTLPVELSSFTATYLVDNGLVSIQWTTETETDNLGWNIYRGKNADAYSNGNTIKINSDIIPGNGTTSQSTDYHFTDEYNVEPDLTYWYWLESVDYSGLTEIHGPISLTIPGGYVDNREPSIPVKYGLAQNYPNPFNPNTEIRFRMTEDCFGELSIYNIKGEKVITLFKGNIDKDVVNTVSWNGKDESGKEVGSGIYFYKLETGNSERIPSGKDYLRKMVILK